MPRYFIKEGGEPYKEVTPDEYETAAKEAHLNNFWHAVPVLVTNQFGSRYVHKIIEGQVCDTREQVDSLLSGDRTNKPLK